MKNSSESRNKQYLFLMRGETGMMEYTDLVSDEVSSHSLRSSSSGTSPFCMTSESSAASPRPKTYFCDYEGCYKSFTRPSLLTDHQTTIHHGIKLFKCNVCDSGFTKKSHLERHLHTHSSEKPFNCSVCGKGVTTRQQLKRHEITHTKSFKCTYEGCTEAFYKHPQLRSHILSFHEQKLTCKECGKTFQRPYRLKNHISKHHNPDTAFSYQCDFPACTHAFKTWSALQQHIKVDHPKLTCPKCGKHCVGESGLSMHMIIHDDNLVTKNWKCSVCDERSFAKKADLMTHYLEIHKDAIPWVLESNSNVTGVNLNNAETGGNYDITTEMDTSKRPKRRRSEKGELEGIKTEIKIRKYIESGKSALSLVLNAAGKKHRCPLLGCSRSFKTIEKYESHIAKHRLHQLKLKELEQKNALDTDREQEKQASEDQYKSTLFE
ncbi:HHL306Wp [Eremothecium sinecaudum]|uniref:Transcription factor IIIA n=1 Tax=Eremothecium sinecaudum TaxID=45286 RepID=A0A0X8HW06_9SACH|nr:HHL306Wp [Eremothecium sinecaudum]AMD22464.1 HHL306Wp [Eremothecium sinecaudum]